jgi:hypothetical protein
MSIAEDSIALKSLRKESERWAEIRRRMAELELEVDARLKMRAAQMRGEMRSLFNENEWVRSVRSTMAEFEKSRLAEIAQGKRQIDDLVKAAEEVRSDLAARREQELRELSETPGP